MPISSSIDSFLAATRGPKRQAKQLTSDRMKLLATQGGLLRVFDSGGKRHPLLMVPDGPSVLEHYADLIELLEENFRVICFDLPGFGFSYPAPRYNFSIVQTADVVLELMDQLAIPYAALAFTCANGFVALRIAKIAPNRVSHLVLGQTPSFPAMRQWDAELIPRIVHVPWLGQLLTAGITRKMSARWYDKALSPNNEQKSQFVAIADQALKSGGCFCLASLVQGLSHTKDSDISDVTVPTLMIHGTRDRSHRKTDFASLRDHAPQAEIIPFQGCTHFPDLERPQAYAQQIQQFVQPTRSTS